MKKFFKKLFIIFRIYQVKGRMMEKDLDFYVIGYINWKRERKVLELKLNELINFKNSC